MALSDWNFSVVYSHAILFKTSLWILLRHDKQSKNQFKLLIRMRKRTRWSGRPRRRTGSNRPSSRETLPSKPEIVSQGSFPLF